MQPFLSEGRDDGQISPDDISVGMDIRLQRIISLRKHGILPEISASAGSDEVAVIAKVTDALAWEMTSEVRAPVRIGSSDAREGTTIVTGRIPATRIEAVRKLEFVRSMKAAQPLRPALKDSVTETEADPAGLPAERLGEGGAGVVIGIIDYGCDFAHRNFLTPAGRTRLLSIWHQDGITTAGSPLRYGREYDAAAIDAALSQPNPYSALGYGPKPDTAKAKGTHGTHVMDIAAGNGAGSGAAGFAPLADLVFVDVSHDDIAFEGPEVVETSFGDSTRLLEAVKYVFDKAGDRPCVVNISLGTNGGPHDGTTLVEQGIDRLLSEAPNRAVTIAAANAYADRIHASGTVGQGAAVDLIWHVPPGARTDKEFELWYEGRDRISVELINPSGASLGTIPPGGRGTVVENDVGVAFAANRLADPNNGDNTIGIFLHRSVEPGDWTVRLTGGAIVSGVFHAWIERDDASQSAFVTPDDKSITIGSISCGRFVIAVGSYDAHKPGQPLSWFASAGPTRDGRLKPEISGPGHDVLAAHSRTTFGAISKSGTSMAAPAVAGIIALMLGEARARGLDLSSIEIQDILIASARRDPPGAGGWHDRYGHGRVHAKRAIEEIVRRTAVPSV